MGVAAAWAGAGRRVVVGVRSSNPHVLNDDATVQVLASSQSEAVGPTVLYNPCSYSREGYAGHDTANAPSWPKVGEELRGLAGGRFCLTEGCHTWCITAGKVWCR